MRKKQEVCAITAGALFIAAAGTVETLPAVSFALIAAMVLPIVLGKLGKRRLTCEDIERRCRRAKD
jgi:PIN domain nuclease of toxin-antitoxin system